MNVDFLGNEIGFDDNACLIKDFLGFKDIRELSENKFYFEKLMYYKKILPFMNPSKKKIFIKLHILNRNNYYKLYKEPWDRVGYISKVSKLPEIKELESSLTEYDKTLFSRYFFEYMFIEQPHIEHSDDTWYAIWSDKPKKEYLPLSDRMPNAFWNFGPNGIDGFSNPLAQIMCNTIWRAIQNHKDTEKIDSGMLEVLYAEEEEEEPEKWKECSYLLEVVKESEKLDYKEIIEKTGIEELCSEFIIYPILYRMTFGLEDYIKDLTLPELFCLYAEYSKY